MRDLTLAGLDLIAGGYYDSDDEDIVVTGSPYPSYQPPTYYWPPTNYGPSSPPPYYYGGGSPPPPPPPSPLATTLANYDHVVVGHHDIYTPKNMTPEQQKAADNFIKGVQAQDAALNKIGDDETITVTETWTDASGASHTQSYSESASDYKSHWNTESFAIIDKSDYASLDNNSTGRGSSNLGADPNMSSNSVAGFNLQDTIMGYHNAAHGDARDELAAMEFLAAHETAHQTQAGQASNTDTGTKVDTTAPGTPNHANENLANTIALAGLREMGIDLGSYGSSTYPRNGWQDNDSWSSPAPPDDYVPGSPGNDGYTGEGGGGHHYENTYQP